MIQLPSRTPVQMTSKHPLWRFAPAALALTGSLALAAPALATLGGDLASVNADSTALNGQSRSTPMVQYELHVITRDSLVVHEYLTNQGRVFAVTWQGPTPPDLRQLLGTYFDRFQSASVAAHQLNPGIHRQFSLSQPDLVMQTSGRLRDFRGIAYIPSLVPAGVAVSELQ